MQAVRAGVLSRTRTGAARLHTVHLRQQLRDDPVHDTACHGQGSCARFKVWHYPCRALMRTQLVRSTLENTRKL